MCVCRGVGLWGVFAFAISDQQLRNGKTRTLRRSEKTNIHLQFYMHSMCHDSGQSTNKIPVSFTETHTHLADDLLPFNSHARALNPYIV